MRTPICPTCKHPHPPLVECLAVLQAAVKALMIKVGYVDKCRCGATMFWITHITGKKAPYTEAGLIHFVDCPFADDFHKGGR